MTEKEIPKVEKESTGSEISLGPNLTQLNLISSRICHVLVPVTLCSLYVVIITRIIDDNITKSPGLLMRAWNQLGIGSGESTPVSKAVVNNLILVGSFILLTVAITIIMLLVFYMQWFGCLNYYFYFPAFIIMSILTPVYLRDFLMALNWFGLDVFTVLLMTWNFTALGMIAIFNIYASASIYVQQFYLIHNSAIPAVLFIQNLPGWAPWLLLAVLVAWDLFAVLAPMGPLSLLLDMAEKEGVVDMPGLIYSTDIPPQDIEKKVKTSESIGGESSDKKNTQSQQTDRQSGPGKKLDKVSGQQSNEPSTAESRGIEKRGIQIGLGDFIFYSLLIGLTSRGIEHKDFYTTLASWLTILIGLVITLMILALKRRAVPALPVSIGLALLIVPLTEYLGANFANELADVCRKRLFSNKLILLLITQKTDISGRQLKSIKLLSGRDSFII